MSKMNDIFQVDYLPDEKKIKINLPEEVWRNIDTIIMTILFQEELVVEKQICPECREMLELARNETINAINALLGGEKDA
ncbi:MAG: hypothetical protein GX892_09335 [Thermoanaerobacteraceae bacterium]|nr:hypothetical protein [Thermoanaerobacteraceae bacterium]